MTYPVKISLYKNKYLFREFIAENENDLHFTIEMDTGTGWLDAAGLYQKLVDKRSAQVSGIFRVCHSFEKWGGMQQETVDIKVKMERLPEAPKLDITQPNSDEPIMFSSIQAKDAHASWVHLNHPHAIYWIGVGMLLNLILVLNLSSSLFGKQ
jgi:hypothetical protein